MVLTHFFIVKLAGETKIAVLKQCFHPCFNRHQGKKTTCITQTHLLVYTSGVLKRCDTNPYASPNALCMRTSNLAERYIKITFSKTALYWRYIWEGSKAKGQYRAPCIHKMSLRTTCFRCQNAGDFQVSEPLPRSHHSWGKSVFFLSVLFITHERHQVCLDGGFLHTNKGRISWGQLYQHYSITWRPSIQKLFSYQRFHRSQ